MTSSMFLTRQGKIRRGLMGLIAKRSWSTCLGLDRERQPALRLRLGGSIRRFLTNPSRLLQFRKKTLGISLQEIVYKIHHLAHLDISPTHKHHRSRRLEHRVVYQPVMTQLIRPAPPPSRDRGPFRATTIQNHSYYHQPKAFGCLLPLMPRIASQSNILQAARRNFLILSLQPTTLHGPYPHVVLCLLCLRYLKKKTTI